MTTVLAGKSPRDRASELVAGTGLKSIAERKRLAEGGIDDVLGDPQVIEAYLGPEEVTP